VATDAARDAAREAGGCTPRHSVGINLLTRFHRLALAAPRPSLSPSSSFPVRPFSVLFLLRLPSPLLLLLLVSSWLYDYLRQLCPSVRPSNPSPWNLGWHLVNRERRRHSPFCTNFGLPAASERARRKHHLRAGPPPPASRCLSLSLSLSWRCRFASLILFSSRGREIARASFLSARAHAGSIMAPRLLSRVTLLLFSPGRLRSFCSPFFQPSLIISFTSSREFTGPFP
jgi:hypothetical protein